MRPSTQLDIDTCALADQLIFRFAASRGLTWPLAGEEAGKEIITWRLGDLVSSLRFRHSRRLHREIVAVLESPALSMVLAALGADAGEEVWAYGLIVAERSEKKGLVAGGPR